MHNQNRCTHSLMRSPLGHVFRFPPAWHLNVTVLLSDFERRYITMLAHACEENINSPGAFNFGVCRHKSLESLVTSSLKSNFDQSKLKINLEHAMTWHI